MQMSPVAPLVLAPTAALDATIEDLIKRKVNERFIQQQQDETDATACPPPNTAGEVHSPLIAMNSEGGISAVELPMGIWSTVMLLPLLAPPRTTWLTLCVMVTPYYVGFVLSMIAQVTFLVYLDDIVRQDGATCGGGGAFMLRLVCLTVLVACVTENDLLETMRMRRWLRFVPRWDPSEHQPIIDRLNKVLAVRRLSAKVESNNPYKPDPITVWALATGITDRYRGMIVLGIMLPKLGIGIATLIYSAGYIAFADSNENLIL
jgi:hypothetical protein